MDVQTREKGYSEISFLQDSLLRLDPLEFLELQPMNDKLLELCAQSIPGELREEDQRRLYKDGAISQ
jgi:hypothetical protein